jgi:diguanylate cyclase (GGDEF)-like protein
MGLLAFAATLCIALAVSAASLLSLAPLLPPGSAAALHRAIAADVAIGLAAAGSAFVLARRLARPAARALDELRRANEVLAQLSVTDGLTRLHNHRHFQDQFAREAKRAERAARPLALALVDIDDFKRLNDELGHAAGDAVLQRVAEVMAEQLRDSDFLSRYGGEEFALLAPDTDLDGAIALAEKLRLAVARADLPVVGPRGRVSVTVSIGVATFCGNTSATFDAADRALYEAKAAGKDCVVAKGR